MQVAASEQVGVVDLQEAMKGVMGPTPLPGSAAEAGGGAGAVYSPEMTVGGSLRQMFENLNKQVTNATSGEATRKLQEELRVASEAAAKTDVGMLVDDLRTHGDLTSANAVEGAVEKKYLREQLRTRFGFTDAAFAAYAPKLTEKKKREKALTDVSFGVDASGNSLQRFAQHELDSWETYLHKDSKFVDRAAELKAAQATLRNKAATAPEQSRARQTVQELLYTADTPTLVKLAVQLENAFTADPLLRNLNADFSTYLALRTEQLRQDKQGKPMDARKEENLEHMHEVVSAVTGESIGALKKPLENENVLVAILMGDFASSDKFTKTDKAAFATMRGMTNAVVKEYLGKGLGATRVEAAPATVSMAEAVSATAASREGLEGVEFGRFGQAAYDAYMARYLDLNKTAPSLEQQKAVIVQIQVKYKNT